MRIHWYSVISPESCSSILWRSWEYKEQAAEALKLTATDMKKLKLIDEIVREPAGGAHADREKTFEMVKNKIMANFQKLEKLSPKELVDRRMDKYAQMGVFQRLTNDILLSSSKIRSESFLRIFLVINTKP